MLVIDQLDAVSQISGRNPDFFDCINEIISQALMHSHMRIVLVSRRFDFENDHRLRRLAQRETRLKIINVPRLSDKVVRKSLRAMGLDSKLISDSQIRLLGTPAQLKLLSEVIDKEGQVKVPHFQIAHDLYDLYWEKKQQELTIRVGRQEAWTTVIDAMCAYMNDHQVLSVPKEILDEHHADAQAMMSEDVLVQDGERVWSSTKDSSTTPSRADVQPRTAI